MISSFWAMILPHFSRSEICGDLNNGMWALTFGPNYSVQRKFHLLELCGSNNHKVDRAFSEFSS
jgi:hypothetical protein